MDATALTGSSFGKRLLFGWSVLALAGCDPGSLLEQDAPSRVKVDILDDPANATLLVNGAIGDFECSLAAYVTAGGLVTDELADAQLSARGWDYDRRSMYPANDYYSTFPCDQVFVPGVYTPLSIARFQADDAVKRLEGWTDAQVANRTDLIATASAYGGYSLVLLAEGFCSAAIDQGPELLPADMFALAEERFTKAIAAATTSGNASVLNMARLGRARARLGLGRLAEAKADALLIPAGFVRNASYSAATARRENRVNTYTYRDARATVDPAFRNLTFNGVADPRVALTNSGRAGADGVSIIWQPNKYPTVGSPIPIARWAEAQLIIAEADLGSNLTNSVAIINSLHDLAGLPHFNSANQAEVRNQLIEERARELFLEGQRLGDFIRYDLPLVPAPGTPFPIKGGTYGDQVCYPLPDVERLNNPNLNQ